MKENKYIKHKKEIEKKINDFPQFWAFSNEQFEEGLKKLGTTKEEILSTGYGGYIRKKDKNKYIQMWGEINKKETENLKDDTFLYQAFRYELNNHEFGYTYDLEPALSALNLKFETLTKREMKILDKAKKDYLKDCEDIF